jgi:hypothetical protein
MSGLPPTTIEWRTFENGRNVPITDILARLNFRPAVWDLDGKYSRLVAPKRVVDIPGVIGRGTARRDVEMSSKIALEMTELIHFYDKGQMPRA